MGSALIVTTCIEQQEKKSGWELSHTGPITPSLLESIFDCLAREPEPVNPNLSLQLSPPGKVTRLAAAHISHECENVTSPYTHRTHLKHKSRQPTAPTLEYQNTSWGVYKIGRV
jgi:hypothetical protein